jgi:hypothetical protein
LNKYQRKSPIKNYIKINLQRSVLFYNVKIHLNVPKTNLYILELEFKKRDGEIVAELSGLPRMGWQ